METHSSRAVLFEISQWYLENMCCVQRVLCWLYVCYAWYVWYVFCDCVTYNMYRVMWIICVCVILVFCTTEVMRYVCCIIFVTNMYVMSAFRMSHLLWKTCTEHGSNAKNFENGLCSNSKFTESSPSCSYEVTYDEAKTFCDEHFMRLCTG